MHVRVRHFPLNQGLNTSILAIQGFVYRIWNRLDLITNARKSPIGAIIPISIQFKLSIYNSNGFSNINWAFGKAQTPN